MNPASASGDRLAYLEERICYLEEVNRSYFALLDVLSSCEAFQAELECDNSMKGIFRATMAQVMRVTRFTSLGILECHDDFSFSLAICEPAGSFDEQNAIINELIANGTFSWALNRNQAYIIPSFRGTHTYLLHVITTRTQIRGMFFGQQEGSRGNMDSPSLNALTSILRSAAYAVENSILYDKLQTHARNVEQTVLERTKELEHAKRRAEKMALELKNSNKELELLSLTDPLTGLNNRRFLTNDLEREFARSKRKNQPLSLIVLDIDHFKKVNDLFGHQNGDLVIRAVASVCGNMMRHSDTVARYGGDEFVIVLPETDIPVGTQIAERLKKQVADLHLPAPMEHFCVSISLGLACFPADGINSADELFFRADEALLQAKSRGRNRVLVMS